MGISGWVKSREPRGGEWGAHNLLRAWPREKDSERNRTGERFEAELWPGLESGFRSIPQGALGHALHLRVGPTLRQQAWLLVPHVSQSLAAVAWA